MAYALKKLEVFTLAQANYGQKQFRLCDSRRFAFQQFISCNRSMPHTAGCNSKWNNVLSGVPQGSVLGQYYF